MRNSAPVATQCFYISIGVEDFSGGGGGGGASVSEPIALFVLARKYAKLHKA